MCRGRKQKRGGHSIKKTGGTKRSLRYEDQRERQKNRERGNSREFPQTSNATADLDARFGKQTSLEKKLKKKKLTLESTLCDQKEKGKGGRWSPLLTYWVDGTEKNNISVQGQPFPTPARDGKRGT